MRSYVYSHEEKDQVNTEESIEPEEFEEFHIEENVSLTFNLKGKIHLSTGWSKKMISLFSRSYSFLSYIEKKLWGSKNPENGSFKKSQPIKKETYCFFLFVFI